jgi:glycosyltransferase involved in cell wall biosynthesis
MDDKLKLDFRKTEILYNRLEYSTNCNLLAIMRIRDEANILQDTLAHISQFADKICVYDDCSEDESLDILLKHPKVGLIIKNNLWLPEIENRLMEETRHRGLLLQEAKNRCSIKWVMCCDADERYEGPIKEFVMSDSFYQIDGVRFELYDAYASGECNEMYSQGNKLVDLKRKYGPECREILMLWRNKPNIDFIGLDQREPTNVNNIYTLFKCKHFGKAISENQWERKCKYYTDHFPWIPYGIKWSSRVGKFIHTLSDFGRPLYDWGDVLFENKVTNFDR